ncbi:MAG: hypothetical protein MJ082_05140 [Clostridia bacterium]|nr:hypothetical protein [Clostridia bacterium]
MNDCQRKNNRKPADSASKNPAVTLRGGFVPAKNEPKENPAVTRIDGGDLRTKGR